MDEQKLCACGCGEPLVWKSHHKWREPKYLPRHHFKPGLRVFIPRPEEIPSGICECGCGKKTELATLHNRARRHFIGYPKPYWGRHSILKKGAESVKWKGGKHSHHGYVQVYQPAHPNADHFGYVPEHRLVMEKTLGRFLETGEICHHINHVKDDNRPENLMLLTASEHSTLHGPERRHEIEDQRRAGMKGAAARWHKTPVPPSSPYCSRTGT